MFQKMTIVMFDNKSLNFNKKKSVLNPGYFFQIVNAG